MHADTSEPADGAAPGPSAEGAVLLLDRAGVIRHASRAAGEALGKASMHLVGRALHEVIPEAKATVYPWVDALVDAREMPPPRLLDIVVDAGPERTYDGVLYALRTGPAEVPEQSVAGLAMRPSSARMAHAEALDAQQALLDRIARGATVRDTLREVVRDAERQLPPETFCAIAVVEESAARLERAVVVGLPKDVAGMYAGQGLAQGTCPAAVSAREGRPIIALDLDGTPAWREFAGSIRRHGLRAVWSQPVEAGGGRRRAALDVLLTARRVPSPAEERVIRQACALAALALDLDALRTELSARSANLASIVASLPVVLWETDARGVVTLMDGGALPAVKLRAADAVGRSAEDVFGASDATLALVRRALAGESVWADVPALGRIFAIGVAPIEESSGGVRGMRGLALDITERRALEESALATQKMEALGQVARGFAEDLANVLAAIRGHAALAAHSRELPPRVIESLEVIQLAAARGRTLTQNMMALGTPAPIRPRIIRVRDALDDALRILAPVLPPQIEVRIEDRAAGADRVLADPNLLQQVLLGLLFRARDAMPSGGALTVAIERMTDPAQRPLLSVRVRDTGVGIAAAVLPRVFEPFAEGDDGQGPGGHLALALVRSFAVSCGGRVEVNSDPAGGTEFLLSLPCAVDGEARATAERPVVILGEPHPLLRPMLVEALQQASFEVVARETASSVLEAVAAAAPRPCAVVVDGALIADSPSGFAALVAEAAGRAIPLVVATARAGEWRAAEGLVVAVRPVDVEWLRAHLLDRVGGGTTAAADVRKPPSLPTL
jgi:signal transduction histidine kinase